MSLYHPQHSHYVFIECLLATLMNSYIIVLIKLLLTFSFLYLLLSLSFLSIFFFLFFAPLSFLPPLFVFLLCPVSRRNGRTRSSLAHWHLSQWEEWGHEQPAGHWQHGRCLLHVGGGHGSQPHHLHLWTPFLLAIPALLYGCLFWQAWHGLLHQQSKCLDLDS